MRVSKHRSRAKGVRHRSVGNAVNRVFDSSGPEGKVRGTPQQIAGKYDQLARDAQLGDDRVAAENFQQHAEHYVRLLGAARREQEARRAQQRPPRPDGMRDGSEGPPPGRGDGAEASDAPFDAVLDGGAGAGSGLIDTAEAGGGGGGGARPGRGRRKPGAPGAAGPVPSDADGGPAGPVGSATD